jgi:hypothetical protein
LRHLCFDDMGLGAMRARGGGGKEGGASTLSIKEDKKSAELEAGAETGLIGVGRGIAAGVG